MISGVLKGVGWFLVVVMVSWLTLTPAHPSTVMDRLIFGILLILTGYVVDIKELLKEKNYR